MSSFLAFKGKICPKEIYVAVSGGVDSVVMCAFLAESRDVKVLHCNHQVPQYLEHEDRIEAMVREFCKHLGVDIKVIANDIDYDECQSLEAQCHDFRMRCYNSLDRDVVVCHHLNDAYESMLMNAFCGQAHYAPIPMITDLLNGHRLIRPFLKTTQENILEYAERHDLNQFVYHDPMNNDKSFRRNLMRHEVIPYLESHKLTSRKIALKRLMECYDMKDSSDDGIAMRYPLKSVPRSTKSPEHVQTVFQACKTAAGKHLVRLKWLNSDVFDFSLNDIPKMSSEEIAKHIHTFRQKYAQPLSESMSDNNWTQ